MTKLKKLVSFLLCACMLMAAAALAEDTAADLSADTVLATLNGESIVWSDVEPNYNSLASNYGSYYDLTQQSTIELFRAVALENRITEVLLMQKARELGLDQLTEQEIADATASAETDWEAAIGSYLSYFHADLTDESSDEDKAAARTEAEAYYNDAGYDLETMRTEYQRYAVLDKVQAVMTQDATATDADVEAAYQALVAADKELYENDIEAYVAYNSYVDQMAMYAAMYGSANDMDYAWYKPAGFRAVKHILLPVDEALMTTYTDLQARYEEQQEAVDTEGTPATDAADAADAAEPVTEQQVSEAKAAILNSLADKIEEINQKIADGVDFDELIATYGVNADGTASDPGMSAEPYMTSGYEVSSASTNYVPEFVEAAMSLASIGDVSAPYLSDYGVHIVKYIADVPAGPVAMTDAQRQTKLASLLNERQNELYSATMQQWLDESAVEYTGATPSLAEIEAAEAAAADEADAAEPTAEPAAAE